MFDPGYYGISGGLYSCSVGWKPNFKIKPETYESYAKKLDLELMNYEIFAVQSCEAMYAELIRSMQKVGLTMGKTKRAMLN